MPCTSASSSLDGSLDAEKVSSLHMRKHQVWDIRELQKPDFDHRLSEGLLLRSSTTARQAFVL